MASSEEEIYKKIEEIYNSEKGKNFITHLTRSFLPIDRSRFMFSKDSSKKMRCAITGTPLISRDEIMEFQLDNVNEILKNFSDRLMGTCTENIVVEKFKGKVIAIECDKSDKLLSLDAVKQLFNFVASELLKGNKHMNYLLKDERSKEMSTESQSESPKSEEKSRVNQFNNKEVKKTPIQNNNTPNQNNNVSKAPIHKSTTSLGDFSALKGLKDKLESEGK